MPLLWADSLVLCYSDLREAKSWRMQVFGCSESPVPKDWDCPLPSDVALRFRGFDEPTLLLCDSAEVKTAGFGRSNGHCVIFCSNLKKAREYLSGRGVSAGPTQHAGADFFELLDIEGNTIEICEEP